MAADLDQLTPDFKNRMLATYAACAKDGYEFRPNFTGRSPWQQARLWRQSRTAEQIQTGITKLREGNAFYLASVLDGVGPQHGPWATNALPGQSWHNFRPSKACDSFLVVDGKAIWDGAHAGYLALAKWGTVNGLTNMRRIHDYGHLQADSREIPQVYPLHILSQSMHDQWGETEVKPSADA